MKKFLRVTFILFLFVLPPATPVKAFPIVEALRQFLKKAFKAAALKMLRLENSLQSQVNKAKVIENYMAKSKLREISDFGKRQKDLFGKYYTDLKKVRNAISLYKRIKRIVNNQVLLVDEYKRAFSLFKADKNFTSTELQHMYDVYSGMIDVSLKNLESLSMIYKPNKSEMNDASRLELINDCDDKMEEVLVDLREFTNSNLVLSMQRTASKRENNTLRAYYGISK